MATAASDKDGRCSPSLERPDFSIQRMVLLGNNWSDRSSVGNLILGATVFDTKTEPQQFQVHINKDITVINTPDLLQPDLPPHRLTELVTEISDASAPGPHVFLVVLQPEEFTEQQKISLLSVLERFSEKAFQHSLLLISTPRAEMSVPMHKKHPQLQDMIRFCKYRYLSCFSLDQEELMTRVEQLMKENNEEHVVLKYRHQIQCPELPQQHGQSHFRIVLFGKNEETKQALITSIFGSKSKGRVQDFAKKLQDKNKVKDYEGEWKGNKIKIVKTPKLSILTLADVTEEMKTCVSLCSPGPNVLLLLVKSSDFTEKSRETLNFTLSLFGPDVFRHCIVVHEDKPSDQKCVTDLISDCEGRSYNNIKTNCDELMEKIENVVKKNKGAYLSLLVGSRSNKKQPKPSLNLVLCGRGEKTSVVKSILGRAELSAASPGQCIKHVGEVCGRWVSLVELPSLSGKPLETVMQHCLCCTSLCAPEGVHAFILGLPPGPLTNEDKAELQTLQDTLSSRVLPFAVILVTVEPTAATGDVQELSQRCGGGYLRFNTRGQQQVSELLNSIETLRAKNKPHSFTTEMFLEEQIKNYVELHKELKGLKTEEIICDENPDCLRIVLIGKTGSGKSSSGNTILGKKEFKSASSQVSVTRVCEKAVTEVDGRHVAVVDTPGLFDTQMSNEYILDEMLNCVSLLAPGPHVFLLVLSTGRLTNEEKETLKHIKTGFGKDAQKFTIILLTHGDNLEADDMSIEDFRNNCDDSFKKLISVCGNRYHVFNNREKDRTQVKELLQKIDDMVKENGRGFYTNKMLQNAEAAIKKEMERIMKEKEEEMKRERELLLSKHNQEMEQMRQEIEEQKNETEKERKEREKDLKEKEDKIKEQQQLLQREKEEREAVDRKRRAEEEQERREWEQRQKDLEEKIKSEEESKETIDRKLQETRKQMEQEREKSENEKRIWWEKRNQEEEMRRREEEQKIKKLQDEYNEQQEKEKNRREEEDRIRQEEEEKERQKLKEKYDKEVEQLQRAHEEEARRKAEEFNEFKDNKEAEMETLLGQHTEEMKGLKTKYEGEIGDMLILLLSQKEKNKEKIRSLKKQHKKQLKDKEEEIKSQFKTKEKNEIMQLKNEQKNEMEELASKIRKKEEPREKKTELRNKHEIDVLELKNTILQEQSKTVKTEKMKLKKKQEEELAEYTQTLLEQNQKKENELLKKLRTKHDKEMKKLKEKTQSEEVCREKLEELQEKHDNEIKKLREKLLTPAEKSCIAM